MKRDSQASIQAASGVMELDGKHDFQSAIKRNLRTWAEWRTDVNSSLLDSMRNGAPMREVAPLDNYMTGGRLPHATDHPRTLMHFSASQGNISQLPNTTFLSYGIPRVKISPIKHKKACSSVFVETQPDYSDDDDDNDGNGDYEYRRLERQRGSDRRDHIASSRRRDDISRRLPRTYVSR